MDKLDLERTRNRAKIVESYFVDFTTDHCKEILLYSSKIFRRIFHAGVYELSNFIEQQKLYLTNPLYNEIYMKGIILLEDCVTPPLFEFIIDYEYTELTTLNRLEKDTLTELYLLKTCLCYIRLNEDAEFQSLARKCLMYADSGLFESIIFELNYELNYK